MISILESILNYSVLFILILISPLGGFIYYSFVLLKDSFVEKIRNKAFNEGYYIGFDQGLDYGLEQGFEQGYEIRKTKQIKKIKKLRARLVNTEKTSFSYDE